METSDYDIYMYVGWWCTYVLICVVRVPLTSVPPAPHRVFPVLTVFLFKACNLLR